MRNIKVIFQNKIKRNIIIYFLKSYAQLLDSYSKKYPKIIIIFQKQWTKEEVFILGSKMRK